MHESIEEPVLTAWQGFDRIHRKDRQIEIEREREIMAKKGSHTFFEKGCQLYSREREGSRSRQQHLQKHLPAGQVPRLITLRLVNLMRFSADARS